MPGGRGIFKEGDTRKDRDRIGINTTESNQLGSTRKVRPEPRKYVVDRQQRQHGVCELEDDAAPGQTPLTDQRVPCMTCKPCIKVSVDIMFKPKNILPEMKECDLILGGTVTGRSDFWEDL